MRLRFAGRSNGTEETVPAEGAEPASGVAAALGAKNETGLDAMLDLSIGEVARVAVAAETAAQAIRSQLAEERRVAAENADGWEPEAAANPTLDRAERIGGSLISKLRGIEDHCHRLLDRLEQMEADRNGGAGEREDFRLIASRMAAEGSTREEIEAFLAELSASDQPVEVAEQPLRRTA